MTDETPEPQRRFTMRVRMGAPTKGLPMPYDRATEEPMTDRIEPAMSAAEFRNEARDEPSILGDIRYVEHPAHLAKIIALANDLLPDTDPRKITRAKVETLRHMIGADESWTGTSEADFASAVEFLDALASLLPPE